MSKAKHPSELDAIKSSLYPEPFRSLMGDREKRRLGDAFGLTQFGVNHVRLGPGGRSALRHSHTHEDELVYVLSGELVLCTDSGEEIVRAGQCVGFAHGQTDAHCFENRSAATAEYLEVGTRIRADVAVYPDDDLMWKQDERGAFVALHKDGRPY